MLERSGARLVFDLYVPEPLELLETHARRRPAARRFWQAFAANALANLHLVLHYGSNSHHIAEALFKATARAVREAVTVDLRQPGIPSSKGTLA